ncbi:MAG: tetratricopeptide repeat protein [Kiloniellales bacterium]
MTQALRSPSPSLNRKQRRRAEKQAKAGGRKRGGLQAPVANAGPSASNALLQQAVVHHRQGAHAQAETLYRQVMTAEPSNFNALNLLGTLLDHSGRSDEGIALLRRAAEIAPQVADVWNNLGVALVRLGRIDEAVAKYEQAIALRPDYADAHRNLGGLYYQRKDLKAARTHLQKAMPAYANDANVLSMLFGSSQGAGGLSEQIELCRRAHHANPENLELLQCLCELLAKAERWSEALEYLVAAIPLLPGSATLQHALQQTLQAEALDRYIPELEQALLICFDSPFLPLRRLAPYAALQIRLKYRQQVRLTEKNVDTGGPCQRQVLDGVLGDRLLISLLRKSVNGDAGLELFLTALRRSLLLSACKQPQFSPAAMSFLVALAIQCHHNSYAFMTEPSEVEEVERLVSAITQGLAESIQPDAALETELVLYAMYRPLSSLAQSGELEQLALEAWSEETRPLIKLALLNRLEEARLKPRISSIVAIEDEVSRAVQSQYEENPYPRWISLPNQSPCNLGLNLRQSFPHFDVPDFLIEPIEILVAGCGTGQHPISTARQYSSARVTAIDLSRTSLAYATRMAHELSVKNIEFYQGDILRLSALGRQVPVIECAGVLHHMRDPDAGLAVLAGLLRPGGVMKLGLYSERARQWVVAARERIAALGLTPSADDIRAFRRAILVGQELKGQNLTSFDDFYDLDSCRDLMFHVQEHRYTFPKLRTFLERQSLQLIGVLHSSEKVLRSYAAQFPQDPHMTSFDCLERFEDANPFTFAGMYQFWCQKPL